jgi:hypothetical protein
LIHLFPFVCKKMKSAAGSNKSKRKGGFPSLLSRAKGNPFSSRRIPAKQGQQGKLEPAVPKHPPAPVAKIKFTKSKARGSNDDDDRDSSKMSSLSDHDERFRLMKDSGQNSAPATVTLTTNTPQTELTKAKVKPVPAQATAVAAPAVVTAQVVANKSNMDTITMNVNANGIVTVNKDKKGDSPSLPSSEGSSQFSYGKAFQGDNSHSPHQSVTKTTGAVGMRDKSIQPFENHLMFDKQALRPQQEQPPSKQSPQQQQQRPTAVAVAAGTHHHLHQPFIPPKFEKVMPMTKAETQEKIMGLNKGSKFAPPSPITLDRVDVQGTQEHLGASSTARAQSPPQAAPPTNTQARPKTPVSLVKDRSKTPDSLLERSKTTVSLLEKSKMPLSLLEKSKNPGNLLGKSQTPFSLLERSKVPVSSLKGKSQTSVSIEETAALKSREQKQQPQQRSAEYTHLAITDAAVITEFMSAVAVKKGLPQDYLGGSSPTAPGTPQKNDLVRKLVRKINASTENSPIVLGTPKGDDLARNVAFDKVTALLNRLNPPHTASSEPPVAASDSTREQLPHMATTSSASNSSSGPHIVATHSATFQQNMVATSSTSDQGSIAAMEKRIVDALDQHAGGSTKDPTPRARDEQTVDPFEFPQSPPKASKRSGMGAPQDAPTSPSVSRVPVDAPEYLCLTEMRDPEFQDTAKRERPTTQTVDDEKALESLKNDFKSARTNESDARFISDKAAGRDSQHIFSSKQTVIDVEDEVVMSAIFKASKSTSAETKQRIVEEKSKRGENKSMINVDDSESKESKNPTPARLMLSVKTNPYDDSSDEDIPAPVVDSAAMMAALESTLPPRSTLNRKKSTSPRKKGKSPRKSKKQAGAANLPSPLTESNDMKETLRRKAEKKAEKHKSQHGQQKGVMTEAEARFLARQAMQSATKSKLDSRDPPESDVSVHPLKEVVLSCDETVSDLDQSIQKFPVKNIVVEESSNVSLLDQSKKDLDINKNVSNDEERDRYAPLISPENDDSVLDVEDRQIDESKRLSPREALADSITEWSIDEVETEDTGEVTVEVALNSCGQVPIGQRLIQRWFGQKTVLAKVAVKAQSTAVKTNGVEKEEEDTPEDLLSDQLVPYAFRQACGGKEYKDKVSPVLSQKSTVKLPDTTPVASNARKPTHFFAHDTSEEEDSVGDELLQQGNFAKPNTLREPLGREPIPSLDQQSHLSISPKEPDGRTQLLYQSGEDQSVAGSGERSSVLMKEQEMQSCLDLYHAASDLDRYHAMEETPTAKSRYGPKEPPATAKGQLIPLSRIQEQEQDLDYESASSDQIAGEQDTSLVKKIVEFGHTMMCLSPSSQKDVKNAMRVLGPASLVLLERSMRKAERGKKDNVTDSISQDSSRESKHSIEVSIIEDNEEIEVGPLAMESAGDACPSSRRDAAPDSRLQEESGHVLSPTSQDLLKRSKREADENKKLDSLQDGPSYESKHATDEDSAGPLDDENESTALEALINDVTEDLSLGSSRLENTNESGVSGSKLESSAGKQSQNDELFALLKADSSLSKQEAGKGSVESKMQQETSAHAKLELIDLTGVDSADDLDDGVWLFDLSPRNDLTDGFLQSNSEDSLKDFAVARLGPNNKNPKNAAAAQRGFDAKTNRTVHDTPNLLMASLEDIIEYASKLLLLSNGDQDKATMKSSLVVVQGTDVSFGETVEVNGLEVANAENKAIEIKAVDLDHADKQIVKPMEPIETIDCTDMESISSGAVTNPARSEANDLTERSLSNSRSEDAKSNVMDTESNVETNLKDTVTHPSGKRLVEAEAMDCEQSMTEGQAESKNDAGGINEELQMEILVEVTDEKSELQVDATELREDEIEEKTSVVVTTQKRDILDFFFENTETFFCGPSQHDAVPRDGGEIILQGDGNESSALRSSAIPLDRVPESQTCELTEDSISNISQVFPHGSVSSACGIDRSAEETGTGGVSTPNLLRVEGAENVATTPTDKRNSNLSLEDVDGKDRDDHCAEAMNASETSIEDEDGSTPKYEVYENINGSRSNEAAPIEEDDSGRLESGISTALVSDANQNLSKRRKAPAPEDILPKRFIKEKVPAPEELERSSDDKQEPVRKTLAKTSPSQANSEASRAATVNTSNSGPFLGYPVDSESMQDSIYTSGSKTPSVISERNTSRAPRLSEAFAPKPEIAPTRQSQQKQVRRAPTPETTPDQTKSSARAVEVIDVEAQSIKEEEVIVCSSSIGDEMGGRSGVSHEDVIEDWLSTIPSSTYEKETAGVDWSTMGAESGEDQYGIQSSVSEEATSRSELLASRKNTSERDPAPFAVETQHLAKGEGSHTGHALIDIASAAARALIAQVSSHQSSNEENSICSSTNESAPTAQVSQSSNEEVSFRSSTSEGEVVDIFSQYTVREADGTTDLEGMEVVEVRGHSDDGEKAAENTETRIIVAGADFNSSVDTPEMALDKESHTALCRNEGLWIEFPCIGHHAEIDQQAEQYVEIDQQATNDESQGTFEGGTNDESRVVDRKHSSLVLGSLATRAVEIDLQATNNKSREGEIVGESVFNEKSLYLALGSMETQKNEIDQHATSEVSHTEGGTVDESSALHESTASESRSKEKSTLSDVSKAKSTASLKAKSVSLAVSAKTKSAPSPKAKSTPSSLRAASKGNTASSESSSRRRWSGSLVKTSRSQSRLQKRSPQGIAMDKSSIPQEISIEQREADASSTVASTTSSMKGAGPLTASSNTTVSSISAGQKSRDIKSTPASQEHFLLPLAIAAQRSKQEQAQSPKVASSLALMANVAKHDSQLNISRFGSASGEEPLDSPPLRASASVSSKQHSDFSPTSGRREGANFCRFGTSGDESVHAPPTQSFNSEAAIQNSLAPPAIEKNPTSPKGSTFFSRIEEVPEEIESQSDETSLLLALTRSEAEEQASSPTSEEKVDTAVVADKISTRGIGSKRSILQRMRATSLVSGIRSKASTQPLGGVSKKSSRVEQKRDLLSTFDSSSLEERGERTNLDNTSSTDSATESEKRKARKAFLRAPRLQTVLDRLRTRKGDGDSDSVTSSNTGPVEISELFTRYDSIVKHMVVFDESRLQSQNPTVIDVTDISTQCSPSPALSNDGSVGSVANTDGRTSPQITDLTDRCTSSLYPIYGSSTSSSDDKDYKGSEKKTTTTEERRLVESSSSDTTAETTTPSQKARNLRQQLDQALHTSTMIRDTQERLGAELHTFKSRLEEQRRNGSPLRYGSPQRSIVSAPPTTESVSTITNSTTVDAKADTNVPHTATTSTTPVSSSSVSFQSRIDRVEQKRSKALSRSKAIDLNISQARASPTFDQAASAFDRLKSGRSQNESPKASNEDAIAVRKIAESAGKALLDEDNGSSSDDEDENYADDDRIKRATVHGEFVENDEVQLQNLESIIDNIRDAEERKRVVTSRRIEEAKRSVTGSSGSGGLASTATSSIPVISVEFDTGFLGRN